MNSSKNQTPTNRISSSSNNNPLSVKYMTIKTKNQKSMELIYYITTAFFRYKKSKETAVKTHNTHSSLKYPKNPSKYSERRRKSHSADQFSMNKG